MASAIACAIAPIARRPFSEAPFRRRWRNDPLCHSERPDSAPARLVFGPHAPLRTGVLCPRCSPRAAGPVQRTTAGARPKGLIDALAASVSAASRGVISGPPKGADGIPPYHLCVIRHRRQPHAWPILRCAILSPARSGCRTVRRHGSYRIAIRSPGVKNEMFQRTGLLQARLIGLTLIRHKPVIDAALQSPRLHSFCSLGEK
jgi:hypothetical protein